MIIRQIPETLSTAYYCNDRTVNQLARSFQVDFESTSSFEFYFGTNVLQSGCSGDRNALLAFASSWDDEDNDNSGGDDAYDDAYYNGDDFDHDE